MPARMPLPAVRSLLPGPQDLPLPHVQQESSLQTSLGLPDPLPELQASPSLDTWTAAGPLALSVQCPGDPPRWLPQPSGPIPDKGYLLQNAELPPSLRPHCRFSRPPGSPLSPVPSWNRTPPWASLIWSGASQRRFSRLSWPTLHSPSAPGCALSSAHILLCFRPQSSDRSPQPSLCGGPPYSLVPANEFGSSEILLPLGS